MIGNIRKCQSTHYDSYLPTAKHDDKYIRKTTLFRYSLLLLHLLSLTIHASMDPGLSLLEHIKSVPNLINEDPSIVTPKCVSFSSRRPWKEQPISAIAGGGSHDSSDEATSDTLCLGNWDSMTTFQDTTAIKQ